MSLSRDLYLLACAYYTVVNVKRASGKKEMFMLTDVSLNFHSKVDMAFFISENVFSTSITWSSQK